MLPSAAKVLPTNASIWRKVDPMRQLNKVFLHYLHATLDLDLYVYWKYFLTKLSINMYNFSKKAISPRQPFNKVKKNA